MASKGLYAEWFISLSAMCICSIMRFHDITSTIALAMMLFAPMNTVNDGGVSSQGKQGATEQ